MCEPNALEKSPVGMKMNRAWYFVGIALFQLHIKQPMPSFSHGVQSRLIFFAYHYLDGFIAP